MSFANKDSICSARSVVWRSVLKHQNPSDIVRVRPPTCKQRLSNRASNPDRADASARMYCARRNRSRKNRRAPVGHDPVGLTRTKQIRVDHSLNRSGDETSNWARNKIFANPIFHARLCAVVVGFTRRKSRSREELSMLSNGTAKFRTLRDMNRAALGCPSITGSWSRPFANDYCEHGTQPTR